MSPETEINNSIEALSRGGIILYPTDTVWGLGCDATDEQAVEKIFNIKKRSGYKSLIVLVSEITMLPKYVKEISPIAIQLSEFSEKPLTIVYENGTNLAKNVLAADGSVAIRVVRDEFCQQLIRKFGKPIVSTSANISGDPVPVHFKNINPGIIKSVDYIVKLRQKEIAGTAVSSIIKINSKGEFEIIRR